MKQKNKNYLFQYKDEMVTAYFADYIRNLPQSVLTKIDQIYREETGNDINTNFACGSCNLNLLKQTARVYFTDYPNELDEQLKNKFIPIKKQ